MELIEKLEEEDPEGNTEVVFGNQPIAYVENLPAYYDGDLQIAEYTNKGHPKKIIITRKGRKIDIKTHDIGYIFLDDPDFEVEVENGDEDTKKWVEHLREEAKDIRSKVGKR